MKKQLLLILALFLAIGSGNFASAANGEILCTTPRLSKSFMVRANTISFFNAYEFKTKRDIASVAGVRTKNTIKGFTKIVYWKGNKHTIHVENKSNFSELDDYLVISSKEGHEVTYPLNCASK